jgi:hypothetical protein
VIDALARAFPETQFVLDHLGMPQSDAPPPPVDPFADLDHVLALAARGSEPPPRVESRNISVRN